MHSHTTKKWVYVDMGLIPKPKTKPTKHGVSRFYTQISPMKFTKSGFHGSGYETDPRATKPTFWSGVIVFLEVINKNINKRWIF